MSFRTVRPARLPTHSLRMISLQRLVQKIWTRQGVLGVLGWLVAVPLSLLFSSGVRVRNFLYERGVLRSEQLPLHIISVGNLTVGGTGKTPFVLWLARLLHAQQHRVGILSRGYKGKNSGATTVGTDGHAQATPEEVGDEAVMLARTFSGVVLAGRDRVRAARLAQKTHDVEVLILDDGFQYRRLGRSLDILLLNAQQRETPGWLLPAGPFREPSTSIRRADLVVVTKGGTVQAQRDYAAVLHRQGKPIFFANPRPAALLYPTHGEWQELPVFLLAHKKVMTVSGIADPALFHRFVREAEAEITDMMVFPDHHVYTQRDWQTVLSASRSCDFVVTTEKDLVKLEQFPFATDKLVALRIDMEVSDVEQLLACIESQLKGTGKQKNGE